MTPETDTGDSKETGARILFSLLFALITVVLVILLGALMVFMLAFALFTKRAPTDEVRQFANRTTSYLYRVLRYVTYNDPVVPFPFSRFPDEVDPCGAFVPQTNEAPTTSHEQSVSRSES